MLSIQKIPPHKLERFNSPIVKSRGSRALSGHHSNRTQEQKLDTEHIKNAESVDEELDDSVDYVINELGFPI